MNSRDLSGPLASRQNEWDKIDTSLVYDVAVVGGGIHGAGVAHLAVSNGLSTVLFERNDYASETSSRSTKLAHGGLRYLELLDFQQVFEGIRSREELFLRAPHIVKPGRFLIPVKTGDWWQRAKLKAGLTLYDSMVRDSARRHRWISRKSLNHPVFNSARYDLMGCFEYCDGLMSDTGLVMSHIQAARNSGAVSLNYCEVVSVHEDKYGVVSCVTDRTTGKQKEVRSRAVINCAGPWARTIFSIPEDFPQFRFSRGSHVILDFPWRGEALFLPLAEKGRYYFVLPCPGGTLIGTTERELASPESLPYPDPDEIEELRIRIERDLAPHGISFDRAYTCFAGVRTLPVRGDVKNVSRIHRRHIWHRTEKIISLAGGKYTTYAATAREGLKLALSCLGHERTLKFDLPLDRALMPQSELGTHVAYGIYQKHIENCFDIEQALTVSDALTRRLELAFLPHHGIDCIPAISRILEQRGVPNEVVYSQVQTYLSEINTARNLVGKAPVRLPEG